MRFLNSFKLPNAPFMAALALTALSPLATPLALERVAMPPTTNGNGTGGAGFDPRVTLIQTENTTQNTAIQNVSIKVDTLTQQMTELNKKIENLNQSLTISNPA